jgi:hypothetical protein
MSRVHDALRRLEQSGALPLSAAGLDPEHWLLAFMEDLLTQLRASSEIGFETVQVLLQQHEQVFLKDLDTARRMYRTYPHLFQQESSHPTGQSKAAQA